MDEQQKIVGLQPQTPIKSPHLVRQLLQHKNSQIIVVYDDMIHIHSIANMLGFLPSLVHVLQLPAIFARVDLQYYQDSFSHQIGNNDKSKFGQIVFGSQLKMSNNVMTDLNQFESRLKFVDSNFVRVKTVGIHPLGHLLVNLQDSRCALVKRNNAETPHTNYANLYNKQQPILISNVLQSRITNSVLLNSYEVSVLCLHTSRKGKYKMDEVAISKIVFQQKHDKQDKQDKLDKGTHASVFHYVAADGKILNIISKGLMNMLHVQATHANQNGWILLVYYNRVEVLQLGKFNARNKTYQVSTHKQADFNEQNSIQHIIKYWHYMNYLQDGKALKLYLLKSSSIWQMQLIFKSDQSGSNPSWTYKIGPLSTSIVTKSNIYYINREGVQLEHTINKNSYPNYVSNFATETDNGLLIRLWGSELNYKEGFMQIFCTSSVYILGKCVHNLTTKYNGDRLWVSFNDLQYIKKYSETKRDILKQLTVLAKSKEGDKHGYSSSLNDVLVINLLWALQSKTHIQDKMVNEAISKHLQLKGGQQFDRSHCILTNKKILLEDVLFCERCMLYCIATTTSKNDNMRYSRACYICWNQLYSYG